MIVTPVLEDQSLSHSFVSGGNNASVASVPPSALDPGWKSTPEVPPLMSLDSPLTVREKSKDSLDSGRRAATQDDPGTDFQMRNMGRGIMRQL